MTKTSALAQHTPGPWRVVEHPHETDDGVRLRVIGADSRHVASCETVLDVRSTSAESHANARLIAEAPALLAALSDLRAACEDAYKAGRIPAEPFVRAGNVLAQTEGGGR